MARKAKNAPKRRPAPSSGGTMMSMRSGFRGAMGQRRRPGGKREVTFVTVLLWSFLAVAVLILAWRLAR